MQTRYLLSAALLLASFLSLPIIGCGPGENTVQQPTTAPLTPTELAEESASVKAGDS